MKNNYLIILLKQINWPILLIISAIVISSLGSIVGLLIPIFTGKIVDGVAKDGNFSFIFIFFLVFIANALLSGIGLFLLGKIGEKMIYSIRSLVWKHMIYLKPKFFTENESGQLMSRITEDTSIINGFISQQLPSIFPSFITIIGSICLLLILDWKLTLLIFITIPLFFIVMLPLGKIIQKISEDTQLELATFNGKLINTISEINLVKLANNEENEIVNTDKILNKIYFLGVKQVKIFSSIQPLSTAILFLTLGIILGVGGARVASGAITSGTLVTIIFYIVQLTMPFMSFSTLFANYQQSVGASKRLSEIINEPEENHEGIVLKNLETKNIIFDNISFSYGENKIFNNLSFIIPYGKVTALVGPSGSGKSTLLNILSRIYDIDSGDIKVGEYSLYDIKLPYWRNNISYVTQSNAMMNDTIKNNMLYGIKEEISQSSLEDYAKKANCYNLIYELPEKYDTVIGERGNRLSGGEKQRIDITRNFIKKPSILLLDEATSNLDSESEAKIQSSLKDLMNNKTTVSIAHRLSTIKEADQIIFLDNGKITGKGTHNELLNTHKKYKKYVEHQSY